MELSATANDGFDRNAAIHFKVMSNELSTPLILLCPRDRKTKPAGDFAQLRGENLTYRMRSGTNMTSANPEGELLKCPNDGNVLHCDGSVAEVGAEPQTGRADIINLLEFNARFRSRAVEAVASALLGCGLLFCGRHLRSGSSQA